MSNTGKAIYDGKEHESKAKKVCGTIEDGGPKDSHVVHKKQTVEHHKQPNERGFRHTHTQKSINMTSAIIITKHVY